MCRPTFVRYKKSAKTKMTPIQMAMTGGNGKPKVLVTGSAMVVIIGGAFPSASPPFCTSTTPTAIVPIARVTMSGFTRNR